jgi:predicted nucleic acid-binding protein
MNDKYFIDTNILIYSFDARDPNKQAKARNLIARALEQGILTIFLRHKHFEFTAFIGVLSLSPFDIA